MAIKIFLTIILVIAAAFLQGTNFNIAGIKPNLTLIVLLTLSFFISDLFFYLILILLAVIILRFQPALNWELIVLGIISTGVFLIRRYLPWRETINFLIVIAAATIAFYLFIEPQFIYSNIGILAKELFVNLLIGFILFFIFKKYAPKTRFRF